MGAVRRRPMTSATPLGPPQVRSPLQLRCYMRDFAGDPVGAVGRRYRHLRRPAVRAALAHHARPAGIFRLA